MTLDKTTQVEYNITYAISTGDGAKKAFLNLLEEEKAWQETRQIQPSFTSCKRYKIVSTEIFLSKEEALSYIVTNSPFKTRPKTAGCVIIGNDQNDKIQYLFFNSENT